LTLTASEQDFAAYANWLKEYAKKFQVDLHAWVLMTNHVHLLCTPNNWGQNNWGQIKLNACQTATIETICAE